MPLRISDVQRDLPLLNKELQRLDDFGTTLQTLRQQLVILQQHTQSIRDQRQIFSTNNLVFTWTGATLTLSWVAGWVRDNKNTNYPVAAGSLVLSASTNYWLSWNPKQNQMTATTAILSAMNIPDALAVCRIFTGTGAQTGAAGGGGTESGGDGVSGKEYKNF